MTASRISVFRAGLVVAIVLGAWHFCWSVIIAAGWAQRVADFIFWMHFIKPVYVIEPFDISRAFILILVTGGVGFVAGAVGGWAWNRVHRA
jgi:hypothetical protein